LSHRAIGATIGRKGAIMRIRATILGGSLAAASLLLFAPAASAHEDFTDGHFDLAIGFVEEPAYAGQPNGVQLFLNENGHPVTDLGDELNVTVTFGDQTSDPMTFQPAFEAGEFGTPGDYRAFFVPSQPGGYTFHLAGTFHGQKFDETAASGQKTFDDVQDLNSASFPQVNAPSNEELATRIDREAARTADAVKAAETSATSAGDDASGARTFGIIGIVVGALGLAVGVAALVSARASRT
jgi:hypothetical protein